MKLIDEQEIDYDDVINEIKVGDTIEVYDSSESKKFDFKVLLIKDYEQGDITCFSEYNDSDDNNYFSETLIFCKVQNKKDFALISIKNEKYESSGARGHVYYSIDKSIVEIPYFKAFVNSSVLSRKISSLIGYSSGSAIDQVNDKIYGCYYSRPSKRSLSIIESSIGAPSPMDNDWITELLYDKMEKYHDSDIRPKDWGVKVDLKTKTVNWEYLSQGSTNYGAIEEMLIDSVKIACKDYEPNLIKSVKLKIGSRDWGYAVDKTVEL